MSLKSRYRLMRMRSRLSSGRARKRVLMALLLVAAAFVMALGLVLIVVLTCAAAVFMAGLYVWTGLRRLISGRRHPTESENDPDDGVTLEGEYTVQDPGRHGEKN